MKVQINRVRHMSEDGQPESVSLSLWSAPSGLANSEAEVVAEAWHHERLTIEQATKLRDDLDAALAKPIAPPVPVTWEEA